MHYIHVFLLFGCKVLTDSFAIPWTVAYQALLSMGFPRHFPVQGIFPTQGLDPCLLPGQWNPLPLNNLGSLHWCLPMYSCEILWMFFWRGSRQANVHQCSEVTGGLLPPPPLSVWWVFFLMGISSPRHYPFISNWSLHWPVPPHSNSHFLILIISQHWITSRSLT